ncbi:hypothetical protein Pan44_15250 [Caulifigura coniformis]|uniref:Porin n=1 Tax=Caulifigura coniformis TaxID=2527983 RepID=A0A517SBK3_9PLAN|nr:outer membrane beta-barrel protein [Caulifigura coniformis]QDT53503.1 hypothetical protein Pan44_15250 [Caulifigura coniformis]
MLKFSRKACLLAAGVSMGWSWAPLAAADIRLADRADLVFADDSSEMSLTLVDDQRKMCRQQERAWKQAQKDAAKAQKAQEKCNAKAQREACKGQGGGFTERVGGLCSGAGDMFTGELGDPFTINSLLWDTDCEEPCFTVGGWTQVGYHNDNDGAFNTRPDKFNLHQQWFFIEKVADGSDGIGFGGRIDAVYGQDGPNTQAFGNDPGRYDFSDDFNFGAQYGWAIPQAYAQVAYENLSVKIGHFFTLQGYEVVAATGNFFYSHALSMNYIEPFTHTGALATYTVNDQVELYGGWVAGWDSGFDRFNGATAWHGGIKVSPMENMSFVYTSTAGNLGWIGDGYSQTLLLTTNITDDLTSVIGSDYVRTNQGVYPAGAPSGDTFHAISAYNYLLYQVTDRTGVGMRNEWTKVDGISYNSFTAGLNFKPHANVVIRPEYRYNYSAAGDNMPAGGRNPLGIGVNESIVGIDAVVTY